MPTPRVAVIGHDDGLVELVEFAASSLGLRTEIYGSLTEVAVVGRPETLDVLVVDIDDHPVPPEDLGERLESLGRKPSVLLVTRSGLAPGQWPRMPVSVELVVSWDDGELAIESAVRSLVTKRLQLS